MSAIVRLCLDLNIYVANLIATASGHTDTAVQVLVRYVATGLCPLGPVQLVISQGMLDRLEHRLVDVCGLSSALARAEVENLAGYAELGPAGLGRIIPVGTGVIPVRDVEDRGVLETALAGQAHFLVTTNWRDFRLKDVEEAVPGRVAFYRELTILHPFEAVPVLALRRPLPGGSRKL